MKFVSYTMDDDAVNAVEWSQTQISPLYVNLKFSSDEASLNSDFFIRRAGNLTFGLLCQHSFISLAIPFSSGSDDQRFGIEGR